MERQDRINFARQECLQNLNAISKGYKTEQEKQENDMQYVPLADQKERQKSTLAIRSIIAILFFLFLFGMKQNMYTIESIDCEWLSEMMRDNDMVVQMEKAVETMMATTNDESKE